MLRATEILRKKILSPVSRFTFASRKLAVQWTCRKPITWKRNRQHFGPIWSEEMLDAEKGDATPATNGDKRGVDEEEGVVEKNTDVEPEKSEGETDENDSDNEDNQQKTPTEKTKLKKKGNKKPKSSSSLKNKKAKKKSKKKEKETKKKGTSKRKLTDQDETGDTPTTEIQTIGATHDDGSRTHSKASSTADDHEMNRISMKSLRKMEKARQSREGPESFDTEDDGLWVGTTEESQMGYEKQKPGRRRRRSAEDDKADWEASVAADDSCHPDDSDAMDSESDHRDYSNGSIRSYRASGRSYRSSGGSSIRNSEYGFRSLKEDRSSSLHRSIIEKDENSDSEKSEPKRKSQMELRKDLEAQALERVERSSGEHEVGAIKATFQKFTEKSRKRMSSIFETPDAESEEDDNSPNDGGKQDGNKKKKLSRRERWLVFKRKIRTRKGYNVIVSILLSIAVIVAIILIALLAA